VDCFFVQWALSLSWQYHNMHSMHGGRGTTHACVNGNTDRASSWPRGVCGWIVLLTRCAMLRSTQTLPVGVRCVIGRANVQFSVVGKLAVCQCETGVPASWHASALCSAATLG